MESKTVTLRTIKLIQAYVSLENLGNISIPKSMSLVANLKQLEPFNEEFHKECQILMEEYGMYLESTNAYRSRTIGKLEPTGYEDVYVANVERKKEYDKIKSKIDHFLFTNNRSTS